MRRIVAQQRSAHIVSERYSIYPHRGIASGRGGARFARALHRRRLLVLDAAVPAVVGAVIVAGERLHGTHGLTGASLALGLAAAAVLWARRRAPVLTLITSGVLVG